MSVPQTDWSKIPGHNPEIAFPPTTAPMSEVGLEAEAGPGPAGQPLHCLTCLREDPTAEPPGAIVHVRGTTYCPFHATDPATPAPT